MVHSVAQEGSAVPTASVPTNVADILTAAADRTATGWMQGDFDNANVTGSPTCWCAIGAIDAAAGYDSTILFATACETLESLVGSPIAEWNDDPKRTQAEVVAALRAAAEKARTADTNKLAGDEGEAGVTP